MPKYININNERFVIKDIDEYGVYEESMVCDKEVERGLFTSNTTYIYHDYAFLKLRMIDGRVYIFCSDEKVFEIKENLYDVLLKRFRVSYGPGELNEYEKRAMRTYEFMVQNRFRKLETDTVESLSKKLDDIFGVV